MSKLPAPSPSVDTPFFAPDPARVAELTKVLETAGPMALGYPISDRAAWENAAKQPRNAGILKAAEAEMARPTRELPDDLYLIFSRTGSRTEFQEEAREVAWRITTLALGECLENSGRFLPALDAQIQMICELRSWTLPAHDSELDVFEDRVVKSDLWAAMTAWDLATIDYWLGAKLPTATREWMRSEIHRRVLDPYKEVILHSAEKDPQHQRMWWVDVETNWNSVCTGGTLAAALAIVEDPAERALFLASAEKHLESFLHGFGPDGYCSEGMGYWNYGFSYYAMTAETVLRATGGQLNWFTKPQVDLVGQYARRLQISAHSYPAFADCHVAQDPLNFLLGILNHRLAEGSGLVPPAEDWARTYHTYEAAFIVFQPDGAGVAKVSPLAPRDYFEHAGVLLARPETEGGLAAALKGGHNGEMHNHNDVGSFVVEVGGAQLLLDPGLEVYTARTFGPRRYDSTMLNSYGHPVPVVAGQLQRTGKEARGVVLATEFTPERDVYHLDLRSCYEAVAELESLTREFTYFREGRGKLVVTDRVKFSRPAAFGTALITFSEWREEAPGTLIVSGKGKSVKAAITVEGGDLAPVKPEQLPDGPKPTRLGLNFAAPVSEAMIRLEITPV